jgi:hypothetical protein
MEPKQMIIQKVPGYEDSYMLIGGPEPKLLKRKDI